jgi:hypothetical protein
MRHLVGVVEHDADAAVSEGLADGSKTRNRPRPNGEAVEDIDGPSLRYILLESRKEELCLREGRDDQVDGVGG